MSNSDQHTSNQPTCISEKQRDPRYSMFVKSHVVCILLLLAFSIEAMLILLYTALFTRGQSLIYLKAAGVNPGLLPKNAAYYYNEERW